jgi:peptidoglycan hydrolase-like protein with peptidoglycan-binding domain
MPLSSDLFTKPNRDQRLEDCLTIDSKHITLGAIGDHVSKIQIALIRLTAGAGRENLNLTVDGKYGPDTAAAVKI